MRTDLCGSCELVQRVRGAAQSTTARSSRLAPAGRARQLTSVCQCPMGTGRRPRPSRFPNGRAIHQHPRSQPAHSSVERRARRPPRERSLACTHALAHAAQGCTDSARHARSACRLSGTGARLGTGVRVARRAERSAGAHPANRLRSRSRRGPGACSCAAIRARVRFARRLGTAWRRPLPAGLHAAPSPQAGSFGRGGGVTGSGRGKSHPLSTPLAE